MEHSAYKEMLSALLDGELHGAERDAALAHIETCADCRAYFAELGALRAALGDLEKFDAPEGFAAGVMARLRAGDAASRSRVGHMTTGGAPKPAKKRAIRRGYAALAACAAVVLLAVYALPNALRMGGSSLNAAADGSAAAGSAVYAAPSGAPGALDAPAAAPQAPSLDYDYTYANSSETGAGSIAPETAPTEERGAQDVKMSAAANSAAENNRAENAISNGTADAPSNRLTQGESYSTTAADETLPIAGNDETPMEPLISAPEAADDELPGLTLYGEGAESWLAENGWQGESGAWYADAATLRELPENLTVSDGELPEGYDGPVLVELEEAGQ